MWCDNALMGGDFFCVLKNKFLLCLPVCVRMVVWKIKKIFDGLRTKYSKKILIFEVKNQSNSCYELLASDSHFRGLKYINLRRFIWVAHLINFHESLS